MHKKAISKIQTEINCVFLLFRSIYVIWKQMILGQNLLGHSVTQKVLEVKSKKVPKWPMMISCLRKVSIIFHNEAKNHVKCDASLRPDAIKASLMKLRNKNLINCPRKVFYFLSSQSSHFWFAEKKKVDFCPIVLCIITKSLSFQQIFFLCLENLKIALFLHTFFIWC